MTAPGAPDGARSEEVSGHYRAAMDTRTIGRDDFAPNEAKTITIERVTKEEVHDVSLPASEVKRRQRADESTSVMRLSIHVRGTDRFLPLNRTNAQSLAKLFGGEVERWVGQRVTLHRVETVYFGEPGAVRIRAAPHATSAFRSPIASTR